MEFTIEIFKMNHLRRAMKRDTPKNTLNLIGRGADINKENKDGTFSLHCFCFNSENMDVLRLLITAGANVNGVNTFSKDSLVYEADVGHFNTVKTLLKVGADVNAKNIFGITPLHNSARRGHIDISRVLILAGANIVAKDENGYSPLHYSTLKGHLKIVKTLISAGACVNIKNNSGMTPLHYALLIGRLDIVKALISSGADVNMRSENGWCPLHYGAWQDDKGDILNVLKASNGFDTNVKNEGRCTPLHHSLEIERLNIVKALISAGADVNVKNYDLNTPLHYRSQYESGNILNVLIAAGADVNAKNINGCTPLHHSVEKRLLNNVKALITAGADVNARNTDWRTPLQHAFFVCYLKYTNVKTTLDENVMRGYEDIIKYLITVGADVNVEGNDGWSPLHHCAAMGNLSCVKALISAGADVNAKDNKRFTPLHHCALKGHSNIVKALILAGADVNAKDKSKKTPLERVNINKHETVCKYLIKYSLLYTQTLNKESFQLDSIKDEIWNLCEEEVKKLRDTSLGNSCVSFFKFLTETDKNKIALYSSLENFGISNDVSRTLHIKKFSIYLEDIESQFIKGSKRAYLLFESQALMKTYVLKMLPMEIVRKIGEFLEDEDLENFLSSHKFIRNV